MIKERTIPNLHGVDSGIWTKWGPSTRIVFNEVFADLITSKSEFFGDGDGLADRKWVQFCVTAATYAAEAAQRRVKLLREGIR